MFYMFEQLLEGHEEKGKTGHRERAGEKRDRKCASHSCTYNVRCLVKLTSLGSSVIKSLWNWGLILSISDLRCFKSQLKKPKKKKKEIRDTVISTWLSQASATVHTFSCIYVHVHAFSCIYVHVHAHVCVHVRLYHAVLSTCTVARYSLTLWLVCWEPETWSH